MMLVRTYLAPSKIEGIGVFAAERISASTLIWKFHKAFDIVLAAECIAALPTVGQEYIARYAYQHKDSGDWVLCGDNSKFFNHSDKPNTFVVDDPETIWQADAALWDIAAGEELTTNYHEFDGAARQKLL